MDALGARDRRQSPGSCRQSKEESPHAPQDVTAAAVTLRRGRRHRRRPAGAATVDEDDVKLTSTGYDFGGDGRPAGLPTSSGELHWHHEDATIRPHLVGTLHVNDADGTCARMRVKYFDVFDELLATEHGGTQVRR